MTSEIRFEWDAEKAVSNKRKHGVRFESAVLVFGDPHVYEFDEGNDHGEVRHGAIGEVLGRLLFVTYTSFEKDGEEVVRIISARKAEPKERRAYYRHSENYR
jgi:uncharacterized DUF497 family protein